ncbi:hypothetical protein PFISCL1PPCAC_10535 [Pristionchus fissidentatus]|uniref:Sugar transporter SWEET n=1 Tax=Pristionchus fissidentatus TaxID=1538716 RepID=A0AAV5VLV4_9BILA|nr:hypothetical protein PFISCL1PPCAC_10535 [Pristionchus fissidentatus]
MSPLPPLSPSLQLLSLSAILSTIGLFLCGIPICRDIFRRGDTKGVNPAPFLVTTLSCSLILQYGLLRQDKVVITVNTVGLTLQASYLLFYYAYTKGRREKRRLRHFMIGEGILFALVEYIIHFGELKHPESVLGTLCVIFNVSSVASPLLTLREVIRSKNSSSLPLPLCAANFFVSLQWCAYGYSIDDSVIYTPNILGILLGTVQLSLILMYPSKEMSSTESKSSLII